MLKNADQLAVDSAASSTAVGRKVLVSELDAKPGGFGSDSQARNHHKLPHRLTRNTDEALLTRCGTGEMLALLRCGDWKA